MVCMITEEPARKAGETVPPNHNLLCVPEDSPWVSVFIEPGIALSSAPPYSYYTNPCFGFSEFEVEAPRRFNLYSRKPILGSYESHKSHMYVSSLRKGSPCNAEKAPSRRLISTVSITVYVPQYERNQSKICFLCHILLPGGPVSQDCPNSKTGCSF
jgi:hypothetical protein